MEDDAALSKLRRELALKVFQRTSAYDGTIKYLEGQVSDAPSWGIFPEFPPSLK